RRLGRARHRAARVALRPDVYAFARAQFSVRASCAHGRSGRRFGADVCHARPGGARPVRYRRGSGIVTAARYAFRIVNVFAEERLAGNPLAVFEDGRGLDDATMQALALQFNLSETTFILPSTQAAARVRIFTPTFEMPFAGHPTLGTAHVVRALRGGDAQTLEMAAGIISVRARGDEWTLQANAPRTRPVAAQRQDLAAMLGLDDGDIGDNPLWVDTGSEQLVIPLTSADAVVRCQPKADLLTRHGSVTLPGG